MDSVANTISEGAGKSMTDPQWDYDTYFGIGAVLYLVAALLIP